MRKVIWIGACAFSGLACTLLAPQAQAQLKLYKSHATVTLNESSLNFSDTFLLPQFQSLVHKANTQLYGVTIQEITNAPIFGTVTNNGGAANSFTFESGLLTSTTLPDGTTQSGSALATKKLTLASGASFSYNTTVANVSNSGFLTNNLAVYQGTGTVNASITGTAFTGFTNPNNLSSTLGTSGVNEKATITYWYYAPITPVPELGTSISLGLMGLVGGALGLRARRRAR